MKVDKTSPIPIAQQLEELLRAQIAAGELEIGQRLPTERELCERLGVSRTPVRKALGKLAESGTLIRYPGRGTFVASNESSVSTHWRVEEETRLEPETEQSDGKASEDLIDTAFVSQQALQEVVPAPQATSNKSGSRFAREVIETLILAAVIFFGVRLIVLNFQVDGNSMFPNLDNGEMLLVNRNAYAHFDINKYIDILPFVEHDGAHSVYPFSPPERGDIVVFNPPNGSEKPYIKRVIGLPGETVSYKDGFVYINGLKVEEPYLDGDQTGCNRSVCPDVVVPEGSVYVMGDNRENSTDSRTFGPVSIDSIIGKAWITYWPFDDFGLVPHYDYPGLSG